jgi:outer membrane protein OmpA-like peptidoglycan-associated protein
VFQTALIAQNNPNNNNENQLEIKYFADSTTTKPNTEFKIMTTPEIDMTTLVEPNVKKSFSYANSSDTKLNIETIDYLDKIVDYLKANPKYKIGIIGHSDNLGTMKENTDRAQQRAEEVVNYLIKNGIERSRIFAYGRGALDPIASPTTEAGRKRNNRVDIEIIPPSKKMPSSKSNDPKYKGKNKPNKKQTIIPLK